EHGGGPHQRLAGRHHRKLQREAARLEDAVAHVVGEHAEVRVARRELRPRVADADDRAAVELVLRHAPVLGPATVDETVDVLAPEPLDASPTRLLRLLLRRLLARHDYLMAWTRS